MSDADWLKTILATGGGLILTWAIWVSRSIVGSLSRTEHSKLCEERGKRVDCDLKEIKQMIRDNAQEATDSRNTISNRVQKLVVDVALLTGRKRTDDDAPEWLR